jgi:hypothetical protein
MSLPDPTSLKEVPRMFEPIANPMTGSGGALGTCRVGVDRTA